MPVVVGIRFKDSGKTYFFDPSDLDTIAQGDHVIVETVRGLELAKVAYAPYEVPDEEIVGDLKSVVRRAEDADFERMRLLGERHDEVMLRCSEKIREHSLPMRLVKAEYSFDGSRLTFYFTAEKRVDFRLLVRDLARTFKTRIELRQIGPRDEAKLLGGIGPCGRLLCCATFLPDYARVSIKMAKDQDLPLNPTKISGVCGRLLCCLSYEHEQYLEIKNELPRRGAWVQTPDGPGEVVAVNVVKETVTVELAGGESQEEFSVAQISEATKLVGGVARSRAEEGITPLAKRERRDAEDRPPSRTAHHGERRLLRNEIDNTEVLDALALLEEGFDDRLDPPLFDSAQLESESPHTPEQHPTGGALRQRRRPEPPQRSAESPQRSTESQKRSAESPQRSAESQKRPTESSQRSAESQKRPTESPQRSAGPPQRPAEAPRARVPQPEPPHPAEAQPDSQRLSQRSGTPDRPPRRRKRGGR